MSRVDQIYRKLLLTKFFTKGWGKPDNLKRIFAFRKILSNRAKCQHLVSADYPIHIDKEYRDGGFRVLEGHFTSPFVHHLPGIMPPEVETASFQMLLPMKWQDPVLKPVCIHLAGTGDHYFWRRRLLTARPLLKESGIASIILENPYYGSRKPKEQLRSSLHNVSDLFVMGGALVLESMALLHWCERQGWGPLGISGTSMGGHMASLAATNWTKPIALVPLLSWSTASCVFTQGVMSGAIPWETLQDQFFKNSIYQDEIKHLIVSPEEIRKNAYDMGQQFVKDFSENVDLTEQPTPVAKLQPCQYDPAVSAFEHHTLKLRNEVTSLGNRLSSSVNKLKEDLSLSSLKVVNSMDGLSVSTTTEESKAVSVESDELSLLLDKSVLSSTETIEKVSFEKSETTKQFVPQVSPPAHADALSTSSNQNSLPPKVKKRRQTAVDPGMPITLSYAKTKELQQKQQHPQGNRQSDGRLTLPMRHAMSKPGLMPSEGDAGKGLHGLQRETFDFMRGVMDECTHLGNFSIPVDPELVIIVSAQQDAYIPREGVLGLDTLWPGCEVRLIDQGHVGAVILHQKIFRKAVVDAFDRQIKKYYSRPSNHGAKGR